LSWIDAPQTQNFEISRANSGVKKKIKISFDFFVKILDGLNFGKRCLLGWSIWNFFQNWKILKFS
jgi:hypothetical protein